MKRYLYTGLKTHKLVLWVCIRHSLLESIVPESPFKMCWCLRSYASVHPTTAEPLTYIPPPRCIWRTSHHRDAFDVHPSNAVPFVVHPTISVPTSSQYRTAFDVGPIQHCFWRTSTLHRSANDIGLIQHCLWRTSHHRSAFDVHPTQRCIWCTSKFWRKISKTC